MSQSTDGTRVQTARASVLGDNRRVKRTLAVAERRRISQRDVLTQLVSGFDCINHV